MTIISANGFRSALARKVFLDRYALKTTDYSKIGVGATVVFNPKTGTEKRGSREIGVIEGFTQGGLVKVKSEESGVEYERPVEQLDIPSELLYQDTARRVAKGIAFDVTEEESFFKILNENEFVPGGRILSFAGADLDRTALNCFVIPLSQDSRQGIMKAASELLEIMSRGGGVGINISTLRPKYDVVKKVGGRSSGSISWGDLFSILTEKIEQGGSRRGALMLILDDWHPDLEDFIVAKHKVGFLDFANISIAVSDDFMNAVKQDGDWSFVFPDRADPEYDELWQGDLKDWVARGKKVVVYRTVKARDLWKKICQSAWQSGEPGLNFIDRVNHFSNSYYIERMRCCNPCVTGDTRVYTNRGLIPIAELVKSGPSPDVVIDGRFGKSVSMTPSANVFETGTRTVMRLRTKEGYTVRATGDHRFMTPTGWRELIDLKVGDRIHILNQKGGFGIDGNIDLGHIAGWLVGDGHFTGDKTVLNFYGEKRELADQFASAVNKVVGGREVGVVSVEDRDLSTVGSNRLTRILGELGLRADNKLSVPEFIFRGTEDAQRGFLQALFSADGSVQGNHKKGTSIRLSSISETLLEQVQMVLLNFGIASRIHRERRPSEFRKFPDGKGGTAEYLCQADHELIISCRNINVFAKEIGFMLSAKSEKLAAMLDTHKRTPNKENFTVRVESVEVDCDETVYDLTEPMTNSFIANGFVVHNCGEQNLPSYAACNLGAINLSRFVEMVPNTKHSFWGTVHDDQHLNIFERLDLDRLEQVVKVAVRFLDNVLDKTAYPLPENEKQQKNERRVGLGVMGFAEMLVRMGVRYGSQHSVAVTKAVFETIRNAAYEASVMLAQERGSFPLFDAEKFLESGFAKTLPVKIRNDIRMFGVRNVTLTTIAPTGTTGSIQATSTGIEPYFMFEFDQIGNLGRNRVKEAVVAEFLEAMKCAEHHEENMPLPSHFVTTENLVPDDHVRVQAMAQKFICNSISKTSNLPKNYTVEQVEEFYMKLYDLGCKGGTVYRDGSREEQCLEKVTTPKEEPKVEVERPAFAPIPKRPRSGLTHSGPTPLGTVHITLTQDALGDLFDCFINLSKVGSETAAAVAAFGRLISYILRIRSDVPHEERLKHVVEQLSGLASVQMIGMGEKRVLSVPDGIAKVISEILDEFELRSEAVLPEVKVENKQEVPPKGKASPYTLACPACGSHSAVKADGCFKCFACAHSQC